MSKSVNINIRVDSELKRQAEEVYAEFSEVPPGGPTLAPVSDKRDEFRPINPREEFSDTEE